MKKIILWITLSLATTAGLMAQPGFYFSNETACEGENLCVDVSVVNFSNITGTSYQIRWDPTILQYVNLTMPTLPGFTVGTNVDASAAASGVLTISWSVANCNTPGATGVTLDDCFGQCRPSIFKLCFTMLSDTYGESTNIGVGPNPYVTKDNSSCLNVGLINNDGIVTNCVRPVELIASQEQGNSGDLICVDYRLTGFDDLNSMQFTINYDPAVLSFQNVVIPGNLPNFSQANMGLPPSLPEGTITVSWSYTPPNNAGITLLDSTLLFQVCYRIVGPCESASMISFGETPTPIEFGNTIVQNFDIMVLPRNGRVTASDCDPTGMPINISCGPARNLGETFCVQVTSQNFFNVAAFNYLIEWNPALLEFVNVSNVTTNGIANFNVANSFSTANVQAGVLGVNWVRTGNNNAFIPNGTVHYEICFRVIGVGGNSPVTAGGPLPLVQVNNLNAPNIGINPSNCEVVINQPTGITLTVSDASEQLNQQVCVDITAANFTDITRLRYSLNWDPLHLQFVSINALNLPGVVPLVNFGLQGQSSGTVTFDWSTMTPVTRPDGTALFRVCFVVVGQPGDCEAVQINDDPLTREAVTSFSNGNNIGITSQDGEVCSLFPEGFFMTVGNINTAWRDTVCVPFRVASFDNITEAHFEVSFNPSNLQFTGVNNLASLPGLSVSSFTTTSAGLGIIEFDWVNFAGSMLPDSTILFELCFAAIGEADGACHKIDIIRDPAPTVLTTAGIGSLVWRNGQVCVADKLIIVNATIIPVSCPGGRDGRIELEVIGGKPPYGNTWETEPLQFMPLLGRNLAEGQIIVTTRDNNIPATVRVDTFYVPLAADAPTVDAGPDRPFPCDGSPVLGIQGQASQGANYGYKWTTLGGMLAQPDTNTLALALQQGIYILSVTNRNSGCVVSDTVNISQPNLPIADAGEIQLTTCTSDTVTLNGSMSSTGDTVTYLWAALNGGSIVAGDQALSSPRVVGAGTYALEVRYQQSGCIARDTVVVEDGAIAPLAVGGSDPVIGCSGSIILDGSSSSGTNAIDIRWTTLDNTVLSPTATYETSTPGSYLLVVTDLVNGCSATDTVTVSLTADVPVVNAGPDLAFTCNDDEVVINATVTNSTSFEVLWTPLDGGSLFVGSEATLNARATTPGTFQVFVRDLFNLCTTIDTVVIADSTALPNFVLAMPDSLSCDSTQIRIFAEAPSGGNYDFRWYSNGVELSEQTSTLTVTTPGFYALEVLNVFTGCSRIDSVEVFIDTLAPIVGVVPPPTWTCLFNTIPMTGNIVTGSVPGMLFNWTNSSGDTTGIIGHLLQNPVITLPGTYTFRATNPNNGCFSEATVTIQADSIPPTANAGMDQTIGCAGESALLRGTGVSGVNGVSYAWFGPDGMQVATTDTVTVSVLGNYVLRVTDQVNGCSATDTLSVGASNDVPTVAIASDTLRLDCNTNRVTIPGSVTFNGAFNFQWQSANGGQLVGGTEMSQTPQTETAGTYILTATNPANQCTASDSVVVIVDREPPVAVSGDDFTLTCVAVAYSITSTGSTPGANLRWYLGSVGSPVLGTDPALIVNAPGTYILEVVNPVNGCTATDTTIISQDGTPPAVAVLGPSIERFITCDSTTITAHIAYTPFNPDFNIVWSITSPAGNIVSISPDSLTIVVSEQGTYTVRVTNPANGCVGENEVVVGLDRDFPIATISSPDTVVSCITTVVSLNGNGSSAGPEFSYQWNAVAGGPLNQITPLQVTTTAAGTYELVVRDSSNGCVSRDTIGVTVNQAAPTATIADPQALTCTLTQVSLNGNGSSNGPNFTITWNGLDGGTVTPTGNPLQVNATTGGRYELFIRNNQNGCEARDTVTVTANNTPPVANAGADQTINCNGTDVTLDGSGSTSAGSLGYLWSAISGGGPINGTTIATPVVNTAGTYQLIVTDNTNGCRDTATVMVTIQNNLPSAMAGEDFGVCGGDIMLDAMLPSGVTGMWRSLGSGVVVSPNTAQTNVTNAQPGDNRFVWTLSTAACQSYSADTITVNVQRGPVAGNDMLALASGVFSGSVNIAANDQLFGAPGFTITVLTQPEFGTVDSIVNGTLYYSVPRGAFGQTQVRYQICNTQCPDLCAEAFVQIDVERTTIVYNQPNGITPNGDGLNEELIFDQLRDNPDLYPNNELIIFNRWNDQVFRAAPYLNNWRGVNQSGQELPQGTYYYILRLNIAEGEIIMGDITIVK